MIDAQQVLAATTKRGLYGTRELTPLIAPRSIAVVGASNKPGYGLQILRAIRAGNFGGELYAVHPRDSDIDGVAAVPAVAALPNAVDLAIIGVGAAKVPGVLEDCAQRGVRAVLIHAAGFAETGTAEGQRLQHEVKQIQTRSGMVIAGPNCLGLWNFRQNLALARRVHNVDEAGPIGIVSQSGGLGSFLFDVPGAANLFSYCLCSGNSLDVDVFDLVNFLVEDAATDAIALVLEGISSGRRLQEAGARARAAGKPIVAFKCGRTERGAVAALSHTASIAGSSEFVRAAFDQAGIVTVDGYDDLLETTLFFARSRTRRSNVGGAGVATTTGGFAVMACDAAEECGVLLPALSPATESELHKVIPGFGSVGNPADLAGGPGGAERFAGALRAFAADPAFDTVVVPLGPSMDGAVARVRDAADVAAGSAASICVYWVNPWESGPAMEAILADSRLSVFRSLRRMFVAIRQRQWWGALSVPFAPDEAVLAIPNPGGQRCTLTELASRAICSRAGISLAPAEFVESAQSAARAAEHLNAATVVKIVSPDLPHKSDVGGVRVGLNGPAETAAAFDEVMANAKRHAPTARLDGALVSVMLSGIAEVLVGARRDPVFGPAVVLNWGGVEAELHASPVVRLAPVDLDVAAAMIDELPGARRLSGYRGGVAGDVAALAQTIVALSELVVADTCIDEVELNPVLVRPVGFGAPALDTLVVVNAGAKAREAKEEVP